MIDAELGPAKQRAEKIRCVKDVVGNINQIISLTGEFGRESNKIKLFYLECFCCCVLELMQGLVGSIPRLPEVSIVCDTIHLKAKFLLLYRHG